MLKIVTKKRRTEDDEKKREWSFQEYHSLVKIHENIIAVLGEMFKSPKHLCDESKRFENITAWNHGYVCWFIIELLIRSKVGIVIAISTSTKVKLLTIVINMDYIGKGRLK